MYNHIVTRLAYLPIFVIMFVGGIYTGSLVGLIFILLDRTCIGILIGAFIALLTGLLSGLVGFIYTTVFNALAPAIGGIAMKVEPSPTTCSANTTLQQPDTLS